MKKKKKSKSLIISTVIMTSSSLSHETPYMWKTNLTVYTNYPFKKKKQKITWQIWVEKVFEKHTEFNEDFLEDF